MPYTEIIQTSVDLLELHKQHPAYYPHLLQSCDAMHSSHRYDILFANPQASIELWHDGLRATEAAELPVEINKHDNFLERLLDWYQHEQLNIESTLPFIGGWFIYLAYEFAQSVEQHALNLHVAKDIPIAFITRFKEALIIDHQTQQCTLVSEHQDQQAIATIKTHLQQHSQQATQDTKIYITDIKEDAALNYIEGVNKIKRYIKDGDVFQVNLSRQWQVQLQQAYPAYQIYQHLREANRAPFSGLMTHNSFAIASSSPERLVSVKQGLAETRPIAGTRRRDQDQAKDQALLEELQAHPKEKAEHIMLIDLERNDLGRICQPGSIEVDELMIIESFEHVHHLVSNVIGRLREGVTPDQVIKAVFPGGTITGCPKVRCMQILRELEQEPRSSYTGAMGYISSNGDMDLNILIRGIQLQHDKLTICAGAGIVADSVAHKELAETRSKAKGMLHALGIDVKQPKGLLETFRVTEQRSIPLWQYHKMRLQRGLQSYGIDQSHLLIIEKEVFECLNTPGVYRLSVEIAQHSILGIHVSQRESIAYKDHQAWQLISCKMRLNSTDNVAAIKQLKRDQYQIAQTEVTAAQADDGLLLNENNDIVETIKCNIFCLKDNVLYTPLISGGVDGVARQSIIDYCQRQNIEVRVKSFDMTFLISCDQVFLCNSVRGIISVDRIDQHTFVARNAVVEQIRQHMQALFSC